MTGRSLGLIAALGSLGMMIAALGFQYIGEFPPCKMCYWQRYPLIAAIGIGVLFLLLAYRGLLVLGALSALTTGVIGVYHVGVEQKWWQGPDTCTWDILTELITELMFRYHFLMIPHLIPHMFLSSLSQDCLNQLQSLINHAHITNNILSVSLQLRHLTNILPYSIQLFSPAGSIPHFTIKHFISQSVR